MTPKVPVPLYTSADPDLTYAQCSVCRAPEGRACIEEPPQVHTGRSYFTPAPSGDTGADPPSSEP